MPNVIQSDLMQSGTKLDAFKNFVTIPFRMSDFHTRSAVVNSATNLADGVITEELYKTYMKRSNKSPQAFKDMIKNLHLDEFNSMEKMSIIKASRRGREEFIACLYDAELYGYGESIPEALEDLKEATVDQFKYLKEQESEIQLGRLPQKQLEFLNSIIAANA